MKPSPPSELPPTALLIALAVTVLGGSVAVGFGVSTGRLPTPLAMDSYGPAGTFGDEMTGALEGDRAVVRSAIAPFRWQASFPLESLPLRTEPGGAWATDYEVQVDLREHDVARHGVFTEVLVVVQGEYGHDADGFYSPGGHAHALSARFTNTGMPIEKTDGWPPIAALRGREGSPFEALARHPLPDQSGEFTFTGRLQTTLDADAPPGHYVPRVHVLVSIEGVPQPVHLAEFAHEVENFPRFALPLVAVGEVAPPRLPMTAFVDYRHGGQSGRLPREAQGKVGLIGRSGFPRPLVIQPGWVPLSLGLPSIWPQNSVAYISGGTSVLAELHDHYLDLASGTVAGTLRGPGGLELPLGPWRTDPEGGDAIHPQGPGSMLDLSVTGEYELELTGEFRDQLGRDWVAGGTYPFTVAMPLSFSTSVKPGTSFLVGDGYPAKVNVNPPVPADVEVDVRYLPNSDFDREVAWVAEGQANRFGHFKPYDGEPLRFDEPGEYSSLVTARWVDPRGQLWMGQQSSIGVVAPREPGVVQLHGSRSFPWKFTELGGATKRFEDRYTLSDAVMPSEPFLLQDPCFPYEAGDVLYMPVNDARQNKVQARYSMSVSDPELRARMEEAYRIESRMLLGWMQPPEGPVRFVHDVYEHSSDAFAWFQHGGPYDDELPIQSIGGGGWNGFGFPSKNELTAYAITGIVRPGFPVFTSAYEVIPTGFYWSAFQDEFAGHANAGTNGDTEGDLYRLAGGLVVQDHVTGINHYDAFATTLAFTNAGGAPNSCSILAPGERALRTERTGREHRLLLASDTHDALEVGEPMALGGVVMPVVPAEVTWTVKHPSGRVSVLTGTADRLGKVRATEQLSMDEPGVYEIEPVVRWRDLEGSIPELGAAGTFWHAALPAGPDPRLLRSNLPPRVEVDALKGVRIPLSWPEDLRDARLDFGVIMPGRVMTQGRVDGRRGGWEYVFNPSQWAAQYPNFDARNLHSGEWAVHETVVIQFVLQGTRGDEQVFDSLRLYMRGKHLYDTEAMGLADRRG